MLSDKFWDGGQADMYLTNSVIRVGKEPVYVLNTVPMGGGRYRMEYHPLTVYAGAENVERKSIDVDDEDVDASPVPLGMVLTDRGEDSQAYYVSRYPRRMWKIGLNMKNIAVQGMPEQNRCDGSFLIGGPGSGWLRNTIVNEFPSYEKSQYTSKKDRVPQAFSRHFLLNKGKLYYKNSRSSVGIANMAGPVLLDSHQHLQQVLEEEMNHG
jgi:hypothetical protein